MDILQTILREPRTLRGPVCLLGVNGAGKSRYLSSLERELRGSGRPAMLISAHRDFMGSMKHIPEIPADIGPHQVLEYAASQKPGSAPSLTGLIYAALARARASHHRNYSDFKERVTDWLEAGETGPKPVPPPDTMKELLADVGGVLGYRLQFTPRDQQRQSASEEELLADVSGSLLPISSLSSGERQILLVAILLFQSSTKHVTILVDEPELHLNEARAIELWESLEAKLQDATFIYATHSVNFATRPGVAHLFTIEPGQTPKEVPASTSVPSSVVRDLVGVRVQIRRSDAIPILCEDSGHALLLEDLIQGKSIQAIAVGGRDRVIGAILARGDYDKVLMDHPVRFGLVDRDYDTEEQLTALERRGVFALPFNEFESLLLHPQIACSFMYFDDGPLEESLFKTTLVRAARSTFDQTLQKLKATVEQDFKPSIKYEVGNDSIYATCEVVGDPAEAFRARAEAIQSAIARADVDDILRLMKGKKLYQHFRRHAQSSGVSVPEKAYDFYRNIREIPRFQDQLQAIPKLAQLKARLENAVRSPSTPAT